MTLTVFDFPGDEGYEWARDEQGRVFVKLPRSREWRVLVFRGQTENGLLVTSAPVRSLR